MNAIVSVTSDWGIGYQGGLLVRNPDDMRFFRRMTTGGTVICGRTTYQSFPHGALPNRRNIVLSANPSFELDDAEVARSIAEVLALTADEDPAKVWLIGGERVYRSMLDQCDCVFVTKNDVVVPADAFFPDLDSCSEWVLDDTLGDGVTPAGIPYSFLRYRRA